MELTSPHEHIKNNLHVEQFSLKTNWKLAERLLYNHGCKKKQYTHQQVGKEEKSSGQDLCPWEQTQGKGDYTGGHTSWGVSGLSHRLGVPVLGSYAEEINPVGWLEDNWDK